jgi:uncharacterized protein (TIGR02271 family)
MNPVRTDPDARLSSGQTMTIPAYFRDPADAERAISELSAAGFSKKDIGVALRDEGETTSKTAPASRGLVQRFRSMFSASERDEYESGDAIDVLDHMGLSEEQGRRFRSALRSGGVLVTVNAGSRMAEALSILRRTNAITTENIGSQQFSEASTGDNRDFEAQQLQLLGETLRIHKERVQRGEVKVRKEVVTERQNVEVPVTREEVVIDRHPVEGRDAANASFSEKEIRVPVSEEQVRVEKRPTVREEVSIGKRGVQSTKNVSDDVRHEELRVDKEGEAPVSTPTRKRA